MSPKTKINVPVMTDVTVTDAVETTTQEDNNIMSDAPVAAVQEEIAAIIEGKTDDAPATPDAPVEGANLNYGAGETPEIMVTLSQIDAFTPDAINDAIEEIQENHKVIARMIAKGNTKPVMIEGMRESLGITDNLDADVALVSARLGGRVAELMPQLREDSGWDKVVEYMDMVDLVNEINETRALLGLPILSVIMGGRTKGASASTNAVIHAKRKGGFMRPGVYNGRYLSSNVVWNVSPDNIVVRVDGVIVWQGKQGEISLSKIHNDKVIRATDAMPSSREGMPKWLYRNGYHDIDAIMLHAKPSDVVEK